jgi:hypothetical protein
MAVFTTERTARKQYECERCRSHIKPGQAYASSSITPNDPEMGDADGKRWGRIRSHLTYKDCENSR